MAKLVQIIGFIISNWSTITDLISELLKLFGNDKAKVEECLNGICNAAKQLPPAPVKPKEKRRSLIGYLLGKLKNRQNG